MLKLEHLREWQPADDDLELLSVVPVSDRALHGLAGYAAGNRRFYDQVSYSGRLREFPELYYAMGLFCEAWDMENEAAEFFEFGFAFTFAAIANQAALSDIPLDDIQESAVESVAGYIKAFGESDNARYVADNADQLLFMNGNLTREWRSCLETQGLHPDNKLAQAFVLGGVICHHLMRDGINQDELVATYRANVN